MPDFTPGPWAIERGQEYEIVTRAEHISATVTVLIGRPGAVTLDANARLIAAAPEMYESLQEAVRSCPCSLRERDSGHRVDCYVPRALEVLAKVEATHA